MSDELNRGRGVEHTWVVHSLSAPAWCNVCLKFIWGLRNQCVRCADCKFTAHKRCKFQAPSNCTKVAARRQNTTRRSLRQIEGVEDLDGLERAVRQPDSGLAIRNRKILLKDYMDTFIGSELVDWMMENLPIRTRADAKTVCQKLLEMQHIAHTGNKAEFRDESKAIYYWVAAELPPDEIFEDEAGADETTMLAAAAGSTTSSSGRSPNRSPRRSPRAGGDVSLDDFQLLKIIGKGGFGKVLKVKKKDTGQIYAMKVMDKSLFVKEKHIRSLMTERNVMLNDCPYLVHLYFSFQSSTKLYFVMDFVSGGDLAFYFDKYGRFSDRLTRFVVAELTIALDFLHKCGVIYRDLKPENILIDADGHVVLTDFGLSKELAEDVDTTSTLCGTPTYLSPSMVDVLKGGKYTFAADLWSLGVVAYEMLTGINPFDADDFDEVVQKIRTVNLRFPSSRFSDEAAELIQGLLHRDDQHRFTPDDIRKAAWFKDIDWDALRVKKVPSPFKVKGEDNFDIMTETIHQVLTEKPSRGAAANTKTFQNLEYAVPRLLENPSAADELGGSTSIQRAQSSRSPRASPRATATSPPAVAPADSGSLSPPTLSVSASGKLAVPASPSSGSDVSSTGGRSPRKGSKSPSRRSSKRSGSKQ